MIPVKQGLNKSFKLQYYYMYLCVSSSGGSPAAGKGEGREGLLTGGLGALLQQGRERGATCRRGRGSPAAGKGEGRDGLLAGRLRAPLWQGREGL